MIRYANCKIKLGPANEEVQARKLLARNSRFVRPKQPLNVEDSYELNIELLQKDDEPDPDKQVIFYVKYV